MIGEIFQKVGTSKFYGNSVFFHPQNRQKQKKKKVFTFLGEMIGQIFSNFPLIGNRKIFDFRLIGNKQIFGFRLIGNNENFTVSY